MSYSPITGSEAYRFFELQNKWLVFEPITNENFAIQTNLFSATPGQQKLPFINILGPFSSSLQIKIEKDVHIFNNESDASEFIQNLGSDNIHTIIHSTYTIGTTVLNLIEVHVINLPKFKLSFDLIGMEALKGYFVRVYQSGSFPNGNNLKEITDKVEIDSDGNLISDTYLKFFMLKTDK